MNERKDGMTGDDWLAAQFEAERSRLWAVAYRILGSPTEAEDAVQECWLHLSRSDITGVAHLSKWLTTVIARICFDMLRSRAARREESLEASEREIITHGEGSGDPEEDALLANSVGLALLVILDTLTPAERLAFVLHDIFDMPFDEIAPIVEREVAATRQLASRARRRARAAASGQDADLTTQRTVVDAFFAASRDGDFAALLALLDPDVILRADRAAMALGAPGEVHSAAFVARQIAGRVQGVRLALVNGAVGGVAQRERQVLVFSLAIRGGKIVAISVVANPTYIRQMDLVILESS